MTRLPPLARAYLAWLLLLVFGAPCFDAGVAVATSMAIGMVRSAAG
jgi:hypothetical protein